MFPQYLLERIMEVGIRVGFGMLAEECRGLTRDEDQHPQENKQLNREVRELKQRLRAKEAQIERLKSSLSVAIVLFVIISCLFIGSSLSSSGQNASEVRPPCDPSSEPNYGPNRFDFDFESDRRSLQIKLKNENDRIANQQQHTFHHSSEENYPSDFSKNKYDDSLYEEELDVLKRSRTAASDESLLFTFFREVWKVVPGVLVVFVTSVLDESCTETKIDFLPVFSIFASFIIIVYGSVFGFSSYLLYDLWNTIMPGVILLFSLIGSDLEE